MRSPATRITAFVVAGLLSVLAGCGSSRTSGAPMRSTSPVNLTDAGAASIQQAFVSVIQRTRPDVVQISTPRGLGSGVVFDGKGDVVTNAHVVAGGGTYQVTDSSGHSYPASLVGSFPPNDVAVVRAEGASLPAASFGDSRRLQVGDLVLAIGNPLGLRSSVTNGIVSALGRTVGEPNGVVLPDVIQTSAPINPGNSGGALVNMRGDVVGIPTLAATDPELGGTAPGIGFAIPSDVVTAIAGQIIRNGKVTNSHRAFLGVIVTGGANGAVAVSVAPGGPFARAGMKPGDIIVAIDSRPVSAPAGLADLLATLQPGQTVVVSIETPRAAHKTVKVKLGRYPG